MMLCCFCRFRLQQRTGRRMFTLFLWVFVRLKSPAHSFSSTTSRSTSTGSTSTRTQMWVSAEGSKHLSCNTQYWRALTLPLENQIQKRNVWAYDTGSNHLNYSNIMQQWWNSLVVSYVSMLRMTVIPTLTILKKLIPWNECNFWLSVFSGTCLAHGLIQLNELWMLSSSTNDKKSTIKFHKVVSKAHGLYSDSSEIIW